MIRCSYQPSLFAVSGLLSPRPKRKGQVFAGPEGSWIEQRLRMLTHTAGFALLVERADSPLTSGGDVYSGDARSRCSGDTSRAASDGRASHGDDASRDGDG